MPNDVGLLTYLLRQFIQSFSLGMAEVIPDALGLLGALSALVVLLMGVRWLWTRQIDFGQLVFKVIGLNVLAWIITSWQALTRMVINTFIQFGLRAGGGAITQTDFTDPSNVAQFGMNVAAVINAHLSQPDYTGIGAIQNFWVIMSSGWLGIGIAVLYFLIAVWVFLVLLEFYGTTAFSVVLIPFGALEYTSFLAEKTFSALCASGIQVMGLAFVASVILPVMVALQGGLHPTLTDMLVQLLGVLTLIGLAWRIHKIAHVITSGSPQLTINDVAQIVQTTMATINQTASTTVGMRDALRQIGTNAANAASNLTGRRRP